LRREKGKSRKEKKNEKREGGGETNRPLPSLAQQGKGRKTSRKKGGKKGEFAAPLCCRPSRPKRRGKKKRGADKKREGGRGTNACKLFATAHFVAGEVKGGGEKKKEKKGVTFRCPLAFPSACPQKSHQNERKKKSKERGEERFALSGLFGASFSAPGRTGAEKKKKE